MVTRVIIDLLQFYTLVLLARILLTWFPIDPWTKWGKVVHYLSLVTDPILRPLRRVLPTVRFGGMGFDLSPLVVFFALRILISVLSGSGGGRF